MTLTIELTPEEVRLHKEAAQSGVDVKQYARQRLGLTLPLPSSAVIHPFDIDPPSQEPGSLKQTFTASVWKEENVFVSQCHEVDVASYGDTEEEALKNLAEALSLHFTPPVATILPRIHTLQVELHAA